MRPLTRNRERTETYLLFSWQASGLGASVRRHCFPSLSGGLFPTNERGLSWQVIKLLIKQGLDSKKPDRATHQQCLIAHEASAELVSAIQETAQVFRASAKRIADESGACSSLSKSISNAMIPVSILVDTIEGLNIKKEEQVKTHETSTREFIKVLEANEDPQALERFMDFEIDPLLLPLYEELDTILIQQGISFNLFGRKYTAA